MKVLGWLVAVFAALVLIASVLIPRLLPLDVLVSKFQKEVRQTTGRALALSEPVVSVFPSLVVSLQDVTLSSPEGFDAPLLQMGRVDIDIAWSSLWKGELAIDQFRISDWTLQLLTQDDQQVNWQLAASQGPDQAGASTGANKLTLPSSVDLALRDVALTQGTILMQGTSDPVALRIDNIDVAVNMASLDKPLRIDGRVDMAGETLSTSVALDNLRAFLAHDTSQLSLSMTGFNNRIDFKGSVAELGQRIRGKLALGDVDLNRLLAASEEEEPKPQAGGGWSESPIDLAALQGPDVDIALSMMSLKTPWLNTANMTAAVTLRDGVLTLGLEQLNAYHGQASGRVGLNAESALVTLDVAFNGVQIQPLLADVVEVDKLLGRGDVSVAVKGQLRSVASLVNSLNGDAKVSLSDGAVVGFNLAAILKSAKSALKGDFAAVSLDKNFSAAEKTDFSALAASFSIVKGVMTTRDMVMQTPLLRVSGSGDINLPSQSLDMLLNSRLVASAEGQGAAGDESGIVLPVSVRGPWSNIVVSPTLSNALKEKAKSKVDAVKEEGKQKLEQKLDNLLQDDNTKKRLKDLFSR